MHGEWELITNSLKRGLIQYYSDLEPECCNEHLQGFLPFTLEDSFTGNVQLITSYNSLKCILLDQKSI